MSKVVDNFLKYIAFDTQSAEDAASVPSTETVSYTHLTLPTNREV